VARTGLLIDCNWAAANRDALVSDKVYLTEHPLLTRNEAEKLHFNFPLSVGVMVVLCVKKDSQSHRLQFEARPRLNFKAGQVMQGGTV